MKDEEVIGALNDFENFEEDLLEENVIAENNSAQGYVFSQGLGQNYGDSDGDAWAQANVSGSDDEDEAQGNGLGQKYAYPDSEGFYSDDDDFALTVS